MERTRMNTTGALCRMFVLVLLCGSVTLADDPNDDASPETSGSASELMERTLHPEISRLRMRIDSENASPEKRELAREVVQRWDNGVVEPEPILLEAWMTRGKLDEETGKMTYDSPLDGSGTAPTALYLLVVDEDDDLLGIHVREKHVLPSGVESSFEETYPAWGGGRQKSLLGVTLIPVYPRSGNRVKDEAQWQAYVDHVGRKDGSAKMTQPRIWITEPDPNAVSISVSVYDKKGHESDTVSVRPSWMNVRSGPTWKDQKALKLYEQHGMEMAAWPDQFAKPRPDNAALLYYRAVACQPEMDPCTARITTLMSSGREPDDRVRTYLGRCQNTIQLMQLASQIPDCDWGMVNDPVWAHTTETMASLRRLGFLQDAHARTLAADGHHRAALENCLVYLRFAQHIGDDFQSLSLVSDSTDYAAMHGVLDVLAMMPPDGPTLKWLRDELKTTQGAPFRPAAAFAKWCDQEMSEWRLYDGQRPFERQWALAQIGNEAQRKEATELTDEQLLIRLLCLQRSRRDCQYGLDVPDGLLERARKQFDEFIASAVRIMEGELPYKDKQARLKELESDFHECVDRYEPAALLQFASTTVATYHEFAVKNAAMSNCMNVGVEVLLVQAETGQLPQVLPEGLPGDPFSGKDFGYERTERGFVLRFDPERVSGLRLREFEFGR
jgi:hypothetical protein